MFLHIYYTVDFPAPCVRSVVLDLRTHVRFEISSINDWTLCPLSPIIEARGVKKLEGFGCATILGEQY